jgi:hypothetical protein
MLVAQLKYMYFVVVILHKAERQALPWLALMREATVIVTT